MSLKDAYDRGIANGRNRFISADHNKREIPPSIYIRKIADQDIKLAVEFAWALSHANDGRAYPVAAATHVHHPIKEVTFSNQSGRQSSITIRKDKNEGLKVIRQGIGNNMGTTSSRTPDDIYDALEDVARWAGETLPNFESNIRPVIENF